MAPQADHHRDRTTGNFAPIDLDAGVKVGRDDTIRRVAGDPHDRPRLTVNRVGFTLAILRGFGCRPYVTNTPGLSAPEILVDVPPTSIRTTDVGVETGPYPAVDDIEKQPRSVGRRSDGGWTEAPFSSAILAQSPVLNRAMAFAE